jgi:hypothetical protein
MAELKTKPNAGDVYKFLDTIEPVSKREDSLAILKLMHEITGAEPVLWGPAIIGFGHIHLKYESGRELEWFPVGFSPRRQNLTFYLMTGFKNYSKLLDRLGKYKTGKSCLYINRLADINLDVLKDIIRQAAKSDSY